MTPEQRALLYKVRRILILGPLIAMYTLMAMFSLFAVLMPFLVEPATDEVVITIEHRAIMLLCVLAGLGIEYLIIRKDLPYFLTLLRDKTGRSL